MCNRAAARVESCHLTLEKVKQLRKALVLAVPYSYRINHNALRGAQATHADARTRLIIRCPVRCRLTWINAASMHVTVKAPPKRQGRSGSMPSA